eukprot:COSAG05_NODE_846_length_6998_cov_2.530077_4_plen_99_part_00
MRAEVFIGGFAPALVRISHQSSSFPRLTFDPSVRIVRRSIGLLISPTSMAPDAGTVQVENIPLGCPLHMLGASEIDNMGQEGSAPDAASVIRPSDRHS